MLKSRKKGTFDVAAGKAKREVGELAGDGRLELEGIIQETKGKIEIAWDKAKDAVHEANLEAGAPRDR